jgi:hypothetical protein
MTGAWCSPSYPSADKGAAALESLGHDEYRRLVPGIGWVVPSGTSPWIYVCTAGKPERVSLSTFWPFIAI